MKKHLIFLIVIGILTCFTISASFYGFIRINNKNKDIVNEEIKKANFTFQKKITNNVYYVSSEGTSEDGTSINNPMSLEKAKTKTYHANDKILLKSGDVFYDTIEFKADIKDGETFYIGSYGEGTKPIITTSKTLTNPGAWIIEGNNIYRLDISNNSNFAGRLTQNNNIGFFKDEQGNIYGMRKKDKSLLKSEGDFYCEGNYLYLYSNDHPANKYGKITLAVNASVVRLVDGMMIENLIIQDTGGHGIQRKDGLKSLKNIYINNCVIQNIGGSVLREADFLRYGNGIEFYDTDAENITIENNIIRNTYDVAFTCQGDRGSGKNIELKNNIFISNTQNCEFWFTSKEGGMESFSYHDNISVNTGKGWAYDARPNKDVAADFLMYTYNTKNLNITLKNNKIFNSRRLNYISDMEKLKSITSDNNKIYTDNSMYLINQKYTIFQKSQFITEYHTEKNSKFVELNAEELQKVSNIEIMSSNNYNEIKTYYVALENEITNNNQNNGENVSEENTNKQPIQENGENETSDINNPLKENQNSNTEVSEETHNNKVDKNKEEKNKLLSTTSIKNIMIYGSIIILIVVVLAIIIDKSTKFKKIINKK